MKKTVWISFSLLAVIFFASTFQGYFYTEQYAKKKAFEKVSEYCSRKEIDSKILQGPKIETTTRKYPHHFSWNYYSKESRQIIGAWIAYDGYVEIYSGTDN